MRTERLAAYIKDCRQTNGLSQQQVATRVGVSLRTVERWEAGTASPTLVVAIQLAKALRVPLAKLAGRLAK